MLIYLKCCQNPLTSSCKYIRSNGFHIANLFYLYSFNWIETVLSSKSSFKIDLFLSASFISFFWQSFCSSKKAISFWRELILSLYICFSFVSSASFSILWNLFVLFRSRLILPLEAMKRINWTSILTWNVIGRFNSLCYLCISLQC